LSGKQSSFGLAVISAGFVASQAFGGTTLPQTTMESLQEAQEFVLPSSSQQLAVESIEEEKPLNNQKPTIETFKKVTEVETNIPDAKSGSTDTVYNSLFKSIESAGKAVGQAVESNKAAELLSQVPITSAIATKELNEGKVNREVLPSSTEVTIKKSEEAIKSNSVEKAVDLTVKVPPMEKILSSRTSDTSPTKQLVDELNMENEKFSIDKPKPDIASDSSGTTTKQDDKISSPQKETDITNDKRSPIDIASQIAPTSISTTKIAPMNPSKADADAEKVLNQNSESTGKASSDFAQSIVPDPKEAPPDKSVAESPASYDTLFKKIEAAGKIPVESTNAIETDRAQASPKESIGIPSSKEPNGIEFVKGDVEKITVKESTEMRPVAKTPTTSSSASTADKPKDSSSGIYMKEMAPALSGLGFPKVTAPVTKNTPDLTLPNFNVPEFAVSSFNFQDVKMPKINLPELKLPSIDIPDFKMQGIELPSQDDIPLAAKAAAVITVSGVGVAVAVALTVGSKETLGSTMPVGGKRKGTTYLEGLSRSSTNLPSKSNAPSATGSSSGSNSYLNNLVASSGPTPQINTVKSFDFAPKPFDPTMVSSKDNLRPSVTTVQESGVDPSFNFAPRPLDPIMERGNSQSNPIRPVNGGNSTGEPNGVGKYDPRSPPFNFSPKASDPGIERGAPTFNSANGGEQNAEIASRPEPPMGEVQSGVNIRKDKFDWSSDVNGGYVWRDPVQPQKSGPGVSYLDNLNANGGPNINLNTGSYNNYLDAMNRQPNDNSVAALEQTWSNSPKMVSPNPQDQDANQPTTIKTFSKIPRTGSYVDSL
jgi:hypothetical protein